jgi:hypothetical protein
MIHIYNTHTEDHTNEENGVNFYCGRTRDPKTNQNINPLGNPFTFNGKRSIIAKLSCKTREEAIKAYEMYFDKAYGIDEGLTKAFDEIYEHYKNGEEIYLQCFCKPLPCHCDVIADRLQRRLIKEKMEEKRRVKNG